MGARDARARAGSTIWHAVWPAGVSPAGGLCAASVSAIGAVMVFSPAAMPGRRSGATTAYRVVCADTVCASGEMCLHPVGRRRSAEPARPVSQALRGALRVRPGHRQRATADACRLSSDARNCGACGRVCGPGERCISGLCQPACPGGQTTCGTGSLRRCRQRSLELWHVRLRVRERVTCASAGTVRSACPIGQRAVRGPVRRRGLRSLQLRQLRSRLPEGGGVRTRRLRHRLPARAPNIDGSCRLARRPAAPRPVPALHRVRDCAPASACATSVAPNAHNCGACGHACTGGHVCSGGVCTSACQNGLTDCSGTCLNLQNNVKNCGACGHACPSGYRVRRRQLRRGVPDRAHHLR